MDRLTNDQLTAALDSKLRRGATYSAQDVCAFALGVEWAQDNLVATMTVLDLEDDDALRFIQRVLEGDAPEQDRVAARELVAASRTRLRRMSPNAKVSGGGTPSAGLPGYAAGGNGEWK